VGKAKLKSLLRYPGGKTRAVKFLKKYLSGASVVCSPFAGGLSMELYLISQGVKTKAYDLFEPLVIFWSCLLEDRARLARQVGKFLPVVTKEDFYRLRGTLLQLKDPWDIASIYYVLNRTSFSGATLCAGFSPLENGKNGRFKPSNVEALGNFSVPDNLLTVELAAFEDSVLGSPASRLYLDPPYMIDSKLYGNRGDLHHIDHALLAEMLHSRENWVLSYNDCNQIRRMYGDFCILDSIEWAYGMNRNKQSNELLILSNDIADEVGVSTRLYKRISTHRSTAAPHMTMMK